jgi:sn1-specific diacylglycerol lipase
VCGSNEPVFQAIWADNTSFDEVIVSPTMINDHMPDNVMDALEKVKKKNIFQVIMR